VNGDTLRYFLEKVGRGYNKHLTIARLEKKAFFVIARRKGKKGKRGNLEPRIYFGPSPDQQKGKKGASRFPPDSRIGKKKKG